MNPLKNTIAINKVYRGFRKYLKNVPAIRAAQARGDHAEAQRIIRRGEDYFCDHTGASLGIKVDVINPENIPTEGPYLVVANHQSYADIYALIDAFRSTQIGFIAKSETKKLKPLADVIRGTESVFIDRGNPRAAIQTLKETTELFKIGYTLAIFPEGTRSHSNDMGCFKPGSFKFAQKAKVPIVPVSIIDSYKIFEEHNTFNAGTIKVVIHPTVHFGAMSREEQNAAHEQIENMIRTGIAKYR